MLTVISPAKSLDYETPLSTDKNSQPEFLDHSQTLIEQLRELSPPEIESLMKISPKLADLNYGRFLNWQQPFTGENARPCIFAFTGDVYQGLDIQSFDAQALDFCQNNLRILSGLYGLLKPLDLMQAYRLEMGTKFNNARGANLYQFWGSLITEKLNQELAAQSADVLVNLASNEYFKSVKPKALDATIITPNFKDWKNGQYKIISFYAKKARGLMAAYIMKNGITDVEQLKAFDSEGYYFSAEQSTATDWIFLRDHEE
jgi:hypothetical protein